MTYTVPAGSRAQLADAVRGRLADGEVEAAFALLGPALAGAPGDPDLLRLAAQAHLQGGRPHDARTAAAAAISVAPQDADAHRLLALACCASDGATARWAAERAVALAPGSAEAHLALAQVLAEASGPWDRGEACRAAEAAARLAPDDPGPLVLLGRMQALTHPHRARRAFERAVDLQPDHRIALDALSRLDAATSDRVAWARQRELDGMISAPGRPSDLVQLATRRLGVVAVVIVAPVAAILFGLLLRGGDLAVAWWTAMGAAAVLGTAFAWSLAPRLAAGLLRGRRTWWAFDGRIVRRRRRPPWRQRLVVLGVMAWVLVAMAWTGGAADDGPDDGPRYAAVDDPDAPGGVGIELVPAPEQPEQPRWRTPLALGVAVAGVAGAAVALGARDRRRIQEPGGVARLA